VTPQRAQGGEVFGDFTPAELEILERVGQREQEAAQQTLTRLVAHANPPGDDAVAFDILVRRGSPVDVVNEVATAHGAELLVVGTHARRGLSHMLLGSVAERLVRSAPCPVLVAHPHRGHAKHG
jgi:nucleotide-binding universal stress UspA family protein